MPLWQRLVGLVFILMGGGVLYAVPVSTVSCAKAGAEVGCTVDRKVAGLVPRAALRLQGVSAAHVRKVSSSTSSQGSTSSTYQLYCKTRSGEVAPPGCDAVNDPSRLEEIAREIEGLVSSEGEAAPFTLRTINWFPILAGGIFLGFGILAQIG
jgi:hypothetical protein